MALWPPRNSTQRAWVAAHSISVICGTPCCWSGRGKARLQFDPRSVIRRRYTPSGVPTHPCPASLKQTLCGLDGPPSCLQVIPPSLVTTSAAPSCGTSHPWICCGSVPPVIPQPDVALMKCTDRIGAWGSPSCRHERPPSVVPSRDRVATAHPVVAPMKSTPTNSSVDPYCLVQCMPSAVVKMACEPTAQPRRGPTIWMAPSDGTKRGSIPDEVGVAPGEAAGVVVGEGVGESLALGDALTLGVGVGLVADAAVQAVRTTTMALTTAMRKAMVMQRREPPRRAPAYIDPPPFPRRRRRLL